MMKRFFSALLALCLLFTYTAQAESMLRIGEGTAAQSAYEDMKKGDSGEKVKKMQLRLKELGYLTGEADGSYWTRTDRAVTAFEKNNLLIVTPGGITGEALELLYSDEAAPVPEYVYTQGDSGSGVRAMQESLYQMGFLTRQPDGKYSSATVKALESFGNIILESKWNAKHIGDGVSFAESGVTYDGSGCDKEMYTLLTDGTYDIISGALGEGDTGTLVTCLQNLLKRHGYLLCEPNGEYGLFTIAAIKTFQKAHGLEVTGTADEATRRLLACGDVTDLEVPDKPFRLVVDVDNQLVYAYAWDGEGYGNIVRSMVCSTGTAETPTPVGVYTDTSPQDVWHHFHSYNCWAQYSYIIKGHIMFHSVLYNNTHDDDGADTHGSLVTSSLTALGTRQSHGCVRLKVEDAKWIYMNCPKGTEVEVIQLTPDPIAE